MKQAYEKAFYGPHSLAYYREVEALPDCKKEIALGREVEYQKVRRKVFFGLINKTYWVRKDFIKWYDKPSTEYFNCNCGSGNS